MVRAFFLFGPGQLCKLEVCLDLVDDGADYLMGSAAFGIIGWRDEVHSMLAQKLLCQVDLLFVLRIVDAD